MEFICPVCGKWTQIHEHQVLAGNQCRCRRRGGLLRAESVRPFRIQAESTIGQSAVRMGSNASQGGESHG